MRITKEVAEENRRRILETATRLFKTHGIENVSVADLMKAAGFTHGGFYNHFASKADLAAETVSYAFEQALGSMTGGNIRSAGSADGMAERLHYYVSKEHRDDCAGGCPTGSLPTEVARQSVEAQQAFATGLQRYIELIDAVKPSSDRSRDAAISTLASLVGAIILSRAVRDGDLALSDEILKAVRGNLE